MVPAVGIAPCKRPWPGRPRSAAPAVAIAAQVNDGDALRAVKRRTRRAWGGLCKTRCCQLRTSERNNSTSTPSSALQGAACSPICAAPASPNPIHPTPAPSRWKEAGGSSPRAPRRGQPRAARSPRCDRSRSLPARSDSSFRGTAWLHNCLLKRKPDTKQKAVFWGANQCVLIPACASLTAPFSTPLSVLFLFSSPGSPGICGVIAGIQPELWGHGALWGCSTGSGTRTLLQVLFQVSSHRSTKHNLLWRGLRSLDKSSLITEGNNPLHKTWRKTFSHAGEK